MTSKAKRNITTEMMVAEAAGAIGELVPVRFVAHNPSGIRPTEFKVLISPTEFGDKIGSIFVPDEHKDRAQFAQMEGVIVALAPLAFTYDEWKGVEDQKPKPGDKVLFAKFAGFEHKGKDGKKYRVVNDKDVSAVLE